MVKTDKHIMDITLDDLFANYRKKPCQAGCGVYCAVSTSLLVENPGKVVGREIVSRAKRVPGLVRHAVGSLGPRLPGDPDGPQHVNGRSTSAPVAQERESLVSSAHG